MGSKYPVLRSADIVRVLKRHGFVLVGSKGSHRKWRNPDSGKQVIVPDHSSRDLPIGTIKSIVEGSAIPLVDWFV